jgi:hypothetical protein
MHDLRDCLLALITISGAGAAAALAAGSSLPYGEGGYVLNFVKIVRQYNMSGDDFRIEGVCKSACTMFLGIRDVCVERDARLMFHAGHDIAENRTGPIRVRAAPHFIGTTRIYGDTCWKAISWIPRPITRSQAAT